MRFFSDRTALAAASVLVAASGILAAPADNGARWWSHVEYLASDQMQGRQTGSPEHRKAAEYVAAQFERDGLKPAGEQGYIQPVKFKTLQLDESHSSLTLIRDGRRQTIPLGPEAIISARVDPASKLSAGLVFVGYGLRAPESHYDDFAGLDTKGKIAVYMGGGPASIPGALASHYSSSAERWKAFKSAGIIGGISIANPKHMDVPWARVAASRHQTAMQLAAPGTNDTEGEQIALAWNAANAEDLLRGTGHTLDELVADAEAKEPPPRFQIPARIEAVTAVTHGEVESQNIAAIWPGSDPRLKSQYVVMTAHIDHVGVGAPSMAIASIMARWTMLQASLPCSISRTASAPPARTRNALSCSSPSPARKRPSRLEVFRRASHRPRRRHRRRYQLRHVPAALPSAHPDGLRPR